MTNWVDVAPLTEWLALNETNGRVESALLNAWVLEHEYQILTLRQQVEAQLATLDSEIATQQEAYLTANGVYASCAPSHMIPPADGIARQGGCDQEPNQWPRLLAGSDVKAPWLMSLSIEVYAGGWVLAAVYEESGVRYEKRVNHGPETERDQDWTALPSEDVVAQFAADGALTLSYRGRTIINNQRPQSFVFRPSGNQNVNIPSWDAETQTYTFPYTWGTITSQAIVDARRLTYKNQLHNSTADDLTGFLVRNPVTIPAPESPFSRRFDSTIDPPIATNFGDGMLISWCCEDHPINQHSVIELRKLDTLAATADFATRSDPGKPVFQTPVPPGQSSPVYTCSLRFDEVSNDIYEMFKAAFPYKLGWTDNRAIFRWINQDTATPTATNPNGWNWDFSSSSVDLTTPEGLAAWRVKMLAAVNTRIGRMREVGTQGAQGVIFWWIEGNRKPGFAYYGCPEITYITAPEWLYETNGVRMIDEVMSLIKDAGFYVGMTLRPWRLTYDPATDKMTSQAPANQAEETAWYIEKIQFCIDQWGAKLIYIDSINAIDSGPILETLREAFPDMLILPEHSLTRARSVASRHKTGGSNLPIATGEVLRWMYPATFQFVSSYSTNPDILARYAFDVRRGDGLLVDGHYQTEPRFVTAKKIYAAAGM